MTELRSDACLTLAVEFEGEGEFSKRRIAGGEYALLRHLGPYAESHNAYGWLYGTWPESSGETTANEPCVEAYLNDPRSTSAAELVTEIWLPLLAAETAQTR